jgi:hypothetical protein
MGGRKRKAAGRDRRLEAFQCHNVGDGVAERQKTVFK